MTRQDRVISTTALRSWNTEPGVPWLQLGPAILDRLTPDADHVLVPGPQFCDDDGDDHEHVVVCTALLDVGRAEPMKVRVAVAEELWETLPTAYQALAAARRLLGSVADEAAQYLHNDADCDLGAEADVDSEPF